MAAPFLNEFARNQVGTIRIGGWPLPDTLLIDRAPYLGRHPVPHQLFGEIDRRRDQHNSANCGAVLGGVGFKPAPTGAASHLTDEQKRDPTAHRRAHENLRPPAKGIEYREAFLQPAADRTVVESAA